MNSIDEIAEALCKGDVINANNRQYDFTDVQLLMVLKGLDVFDSAYEVAEKILKGE